MDKICDLLEYIGLSENDLEEVYYKIHFWSFVVSLADQLEESGSLSKKQKIALVNLIKKHTGADCNIEVIGHSSRYHRKGGGSVSTSNRVKHTYGSLEDIQLYDLPYESGTTQTLTFFPYNSHSVVIKINHIAYRIPLPKIWSKLSEPTDITFSYRRTACKGYMTATSV